MPSVEPVDPSLPNDEAQIHQFEARSSDAILSAAERVLAAHRPGGKSTRLGDVLTFEISETSGHSFAFQHRTLNQKWVVSSREIGQISVASVAMAERGSDKHMVWSDFWNFPRQTYPSTAWIYPRAYRSSFWFGSNPEYRIDYNTFWVRLEAALRNEAWPPCGPHTEFMQGAKLYFYEPLCGTLTAETSD